MLDTLRGMAPRVESGYPNGVCLVSVVGWLDVVCIGGMDFGRTEFDRLNFFFLLISCFFFFSVSICCSCLSDIQMYDMECHSC